MEKQKIEIGQRFGRLVVTGRTPGAKGYDCRCDCGQGTVRAPGVLLSGRVKSCGCWKEDLTSRRFWSRVKVLDNGCWEWQGSTSQYGYGHFTADGQSLAHRWAYSHFVAPIPQGEQIDHLCKNRACVNPAHLAPVTLHENLIRGRRENQHTVRTHCPNGHAYTPETTLETRQPNGHLTRTCSICKTESDARVRDRVREKRRTIPGYGIGDKP